MQTRIYGIRNCDSMKRAFQWLTQHTVEYAFHDYKSAGLEHALISRWADRMGWEALLNTRGTTWRKLTAAQQADMNRDKAIALMLEHHSLIKRPVLERGEVLLIGFSEDAYAEALLPHL